jgi:tetratricopeptide (TPR) repeat protein
MRPDSKLYIIPFEGGEPREMTCNTPRMNSYHSFSPNGRWMVFASKWPSPYTQMYLTHLEAEGNSTPPVLVPNTTAANRAVNLPEFAPIAQRGIVDIDAPAVDYRRHLDRGKELLAERRTAEAIPLLKRSLAMREDYQATHSELAAAYSAAGRYEEAITHYRRALELRPDFYPDHYNWGNALRALGRLDEAIEHYRKAAEADPEFFQAQNNLGVVYWRKNDLKQAAVHFREAVRINPKHAPAQNNLAAVLEKLGDDAGAAEHYRKALEIEPGYENAANGLAWVLATSRDDAIRNGTEAVRLAEPLCRRTRMRNSLFLRTLAAAYAEVGRFDDAVRTARRARLMPPAHIRRDLLDELDRDIALYGARKPLRE